MNTPLRVGGLQPLTTIDYPGHLACVLFCQGCAWRCRYCHNPGLIAARSRDELRWESVLAFLQRRQGLLQAVVFSGGEATLQPGLAAAMAEVRGMGFKTGLHTAGIKPQALAAALPYCDWVGFDVKALPEWADRITGIPGSGSANWQSLDLVVASGVAMECRTTVHSRLMNDAQLLALATAVAARGVRHFVVQEARSASMLDPTLGPHARLDSGTWPRLQAMFESVVVR